MKTENLLKICYDLAPSYFAQDWDNVGLLVGDRNRKIKTLLLCLDCNSQALALAKDKKVDCIISHHPLIFSKLENLVTEGSVKPLVIDLIKNNINLISLHTNLDVTNCGVNEALLWTIDRNWAIEKTLVPLDSYLHQRWMNEQQNNTLLYRYFAMYGRKIGDDIGFGRIAKIENMHLFSLITLLKKNLASTFCQANFDYNRKITKLAVCGGAFDGDWIKNLTASGVDCLISGEIKHHDMLALAEQGISALIIGHDVSERCVLNYLSSYLSLISNKLNIEIFTGLDYTKIYD